MRASESGEWTNTHQASRELGLTPSAVRELVRRGYLRAQRLGELGALHISRDSLAELNDLREQHRTAVTVNGHIPSELSLSETARLLDMDDNIVRHALQTGRLAGRKETADRMARWRVDGRAVKRLLEGAS